MTMTIAMLGNILEVAQGTGVVLVVAVILGLAAFWIWMLAECALKEPREGNDKVVWILIIATTCWIGAALYFFLRRPRRIAEARLGQAPAALGGR